jgi:hypothetical protein
MNIIEKPLSKGAVWRRFIRVRRLPERERKSLGLQPGVGYTDGELTRARFYRAIEQMIAREVRDARLTPLQQIGFDGRAPTIVDDAARGTLMPEAARAQRNTSSSPLDYLYFQSKAPIEFWEWSVGKRFEYDFQRSRSDAPVTVDFELIANARPAPRRRPPECTQQQEPPPTFRPRGARRQRRQAADIHDTRLDAMARIGRLADEISKVSFWLLEQVIGRERTLGDVARMLQTDKRYVAQRFREALTEAGSHYGMCPGAYS